MDRDMQGRACSVARRPQCNRAHGHLVQELRLDHLRVPLGPRGDPCAYRRDRALFQGGLVPQPPRRRTKVDDDRLVAYVPQPHERVRPPLREVRPVRRAPWVQQRDGVVRHRERRMAQRTSCHQICARRGNPWATGHSRSHVPKEQVGRRSRPRRRESGDFPPAPGCRRATSAPRVRRRVTKTTGS